jgi:hypothetical protein
MTLKRGIFATKNIFDLRYKEIIDKRTSITYPPPVGYEDTWPIPTSTDIIPPKQSRNPPKIHTDVTIMQKLIEISMCLRIEEAFLRLWTHEFLSFRNLNCPRLQLQAVIPSSPTVYKFDMEVKRTNFEVRVEVEGTL